MPITCEKCGHENPIIDSVCNNCSKALENQPIRLELAHMDIKFGKIKEGVEQLKKLAEEYIERNETEEVEKILKNLLSIHPDDTHSHYLMGELHLIKGELDKADKAFRQILRNDVGNVKALIKLGETFARKGDEKSALIAYKKVMKLDDNRPEPYEYLAKSKLDEGKKKEAAKLYEEVSKKYKLLGDEEKAAEFQNTFLELSGKKTSSAQAYTPPVESYDYGDDGPPPEDMEVIGLHLPAIELSFGDEEDPFAPSFKDDSPSTQEEEKKEEPSPPPEEEVKKKGPTFTKNEIFLAILREHGDPYKRLIAIKNLNPGEGEEIANALIEALKDNNKGVRIEAAITLGSHNDKRAIKIIIEAAEKAEEPGTREKAIALLGKFGDPKAIYALIKALEDKDPDVREAAIENLGKFNDPRIVDPLLERLTEEDPYMWGKIVDILAKTEDRRILKPFIDIFEKCNEEDLQVRLLSILKAYDDPILISFYTGLLLHDSSAIKIEVMKILGEMGHKKSIRHIEKLLTDKDQEVCDVADEVLAKLGYKKSALSVIKTFFFKKR